MKVSHTHKKNHTHTHTSDPRWPRGFRCHSSIMEVVGSGPTRRSKMFSFKSLTFLCPCIPPNQNTHTHARTHARTHTQKEATLNFRFQMGSSFTILPSFPLFYLFSYTYNMLHLEDELTLNSYIQRNTLCNIRLLPVMVTLY